MVETRLSDSTFRPTAYTVAIDALGRDANFYDESDSYPRVQISRLRRMLDNFYLREDGENRLKLPHCKYELLLEPNTAAPKGFSPQNPNGQTKARQAEVTFPSRLSQSDSNRFQTSQKAFRFLKLYCRKIVRFCLKQFKWFRFLLDHLEYKIKTRCEPEVANGALE